jgi:hypothetical protein
MRTRKITRQQLVMPRNINDFVQNVDRTQRNIICFPTNIIRRQTFVGIVYLMSCRVLEQKKPPRWGGLLVRRFYLAAAAM